MNILFYLYNIKLQSFVHTYIFTQWLYLSTFIFTFSFYLCVTNTVYLNEPHEIANLKSKWSDINNFMF